MPGIYVQFSKANAIWKMNICIEYFPIIGILVILCTMNSDEVAVTRVPINVNIVLY